ncbi:hypothetical protein N2601_30620 (plasmid) [Rhizobium sp. CB3060]|nr:hypothetical protein [Rhizobium tropici]UWU25780.1 hypothetical protein N2601_30620 [Rhizobium tropici]
MKSAVNDKENLPPVEQEWASAMLVIAWPFGVFAIALCCKFFV